MQRVVWFVIGVAAGFVVAHQVNRTDSGRAFFESVNAKADAFSRAVADGYHEREAELAGRD
ncbi:hypothetical protein [Agromyces seonyuensis]|uniref:Uncharacterized protein n=1 Tax=Agromyces seonyuensis TaxID=2662446 RepID=A0A6I4P5G0_9MICO|nr:hypothetical protein [Agromyces seonyuensis]MWC00276.1 hypothetical protein [Agromyces seonyuensis]